MMKAGFHRLGAAGAWREFLEGGGWGGVAVDDFGIAQEVAERWPESLIIGRRVESDAALDPVNDYQAGLTPEHAAERFIDRQVITYHLNPAIHVWTGPNETALGHGPNFPDLPLDECLRRMAWYASFEIWRMVLLKSRGLRACVGNFSTGTPDRRLWSAFYPALLSAKAHSGYLGLHEYMGAKPRFGVGDNPLRYRTVPEIATSGVQLVMTEFGFDRVQGPPGYVTGAWRDLTDQWIAHGDTTDPERYCADAYIWYAEELRKDPYVIGCCIFTSGNGGSHTWARHDIAGTRIPEYLKQYGLNMPPLIEPEPEPPLPEPPADGDNMTLLNDHVVIELLRGLTRRTIAGAEVQRLPVGTNLLVYKQPVTFRWQFGDNRLLIVGADGESVWQDPNTPSVRFL